MTKQVADMVEKLKTRDAMREASDELCALLLTLANRVREIRDIAMLNDLESMSPLYELASIHLEAFNQCLLDCETIIGVRKLSTTAEQVEIVVGRMRPAVSTFLKSVSLDWSTAACAHGANVIEIYPDEFDPKHFGLVFCHANGDQCCSFDEKQYRSRSEAEHAIRKIREGWKPRT